MSPSNDAPDVWDQHIATLKAHGIPQPSSWHPNGHGQGTLAEEQALYETSPSFVELLPWVEFLKSRCMLLEDGESVAAFFELLPIGTEGRSEHWLQQVREAIENALQDSFDELDAHPWIVQFYAQDETNWDEDLRALREYIQPRAQGTRFTDFYLRLFEHHLKATGKPDGLFTDNTVTQLPWRGQTRRVRMVVYRRAPEGASRRGLPPEQALNSICQRFLGGLSNAGVKARRLGATETHDWLLRWFNPHPTLLGTSTEDQERFYQLTAYPPDHEDGELELASGTDFAQRLFFRQPRSDVAAGTWNFDDMPHRVVILDRLRSPPSIGHLTGETRNGGDAVNALFDQLPLGTTLCITLVVTPQDVLEAHLNHLAKKSVGGTLASEQTRQDVQQARTLIGSAHKLYRASVAFFLRGRDLEELDTRGRQLANVMLNAGLQPVRDEDEVAPLNSYLRWLPCAFDPAKDRRQWYTQLTFAQHIANLLPVWGRSRGTGHPGITLFNRGGGTITVDPLNPRDRQMNAHVFLFGRTGSGKSALLNLMLTQEMAVYRPRLFIAEAGNSFGLFAEFARRLGLSVHRVQLAPGAGVTLAPFADARRLIDTPSQVQTLDVDALDEMTTSLGDGEDSDEQRDVLGELEIRARLMITGGEDREEARMTRADRSFIRQCIVDAARACASQDKPVLTEDVRDAMKQRSRDALLPEGRRTRLSEMADALDVFCTGLNGEIFNRPGTAWPEVDVTIVDLATFAREGYNTELALAYISLLNTVNNIAERDQFRGRPIICATDEGQLVLKNPLTAPSAVKISQMWRKLGAWLWIAMPTLDGLPASVRPMLNMMEWLICLGMTPDEVEKVAQFRELTPEQKTLMVSCRKEIGKFAEGVILGKSTELLFRAVPPSISLALAMTDLEEKNQRYQLMQQHQVSELEAAILVAAQIDRARGITPLVFDELA